MEDKCGSNILIWKLKTGKKLDFALSFYYLDIVSLKGKENNKKKTKKLENKLLLQKFLISLLF